MTEPTELERGPWAIYAGADMALLIRQDDPDRPALTKLMVLKRGWESVTRLQAEGVFERLLRGGYLGAWYLTLAQKADKEPDHAQEDQDQGDGAVPRAEAQSGDGGSPQEDAG